MDRLSTLELFVAVADSKSFTKAAQAVGCSPTAASRAIAALEQSLGVALFRRSTRQVALTDQGAAYRDRILPLLVELRDAGKAAEVADDTATGELYVTAPTMFGRLHVLPVIADLLAAHPALSARVLLIDRNVRLIEEGIDVAVRIGPLVSSSLKSVKIGEVRPVVVASPAYLARRGVPESAAELSRHDLIGNAGPRAAIQWKLDGRRRPPPLRLTVTTVEAAVTAAEEGIGLASLLSYQVADALRTGRLTQVLTGVSRAALPIHLLFDPRTARATRRQSFIAAMRARMRDID